MSAALAQSEVSSREQELRQRGLRYTPCYCEENAYFLSQQLVAEHFDSKIYCAFVSNSPRMVDFWLHRRAAADLQVVWDYHVIVLEVLSDGRTTMVWDLDTSEEVPLPCPLTEYAARVLGIRYNPSDLGVCVPHRVGWPRKYRVVPSGIFLETFASDRSHMRDASGKWKAPPPEYPCIHARDGTTNNLEQYINMEEQALTSLYQLEFPCSLSSSKPSTCAAGGRPYGGVLNELTLLLEFGIDPVSDLPTVEFHQ